MTARDDSTPPAQHQAEVPADTAGPTAATGQALVVWMLARHRGRIVVGAIAGIVWMGAGAVLPVALGAALDDAVRTGSPRAVVSWLIVLAATLAVQAVAAIARHHVALWLTHRSQWLLEQQLTCRVLDPRGGFNQPTGATVSLATSDTAAVAEIANLMCRGAGAVVTFTVVAVAMIVTEWRLGLLCVVGMPLALAALSPLWRPVRDRTSALQHRLAAASATAADTIGGLRVIKGLGAEKTARRWFRADADAVEVTALRASRLTNAWSAISTIVPGLVLAGVLWIAGPRVLDGGLSPGDLVAFTGLAAWLRNPLNTLSEVGQVWVSGMASAKRIAQRINTPRAVTDPTDGPALNGTAVRFDDVHHADALRGASFTIGDGEHVAIVCANQRAAAAIVATLSRDVDVEQGTISVGGTDIAAVPLDAARCVIGVEPHHSWLFAGTIADNLTLAAPDATPEVLTAALMAAAADDVLAGPDGLDRQLGERGAGLSGGQRQRVAIARRLVDNPAVVVLHDPTTALDTVTEQTLAERLQRHRQGHTTIILTASPTLTDACQRVILIDDGSVTATGTHRHLLATNSTYRTILGLDE